MLPVPEVLKADTLLGRSLYPWLLWQVFASWCSTRVVFIYSTKTSVGFVCIRKPPWMSKPPVYLFDSLTKHLQSNVGQALLVLKYRGRWLSRSTPLCVPWPGAGLVKSVPFPDQAVLLETMTPQNVRAKWPVQSVKVKKEYVLFRANKTLFHKALPLLCLWSLYGQTLLTETVYKSRLFLNKTSF